MKQQYLITSYISITQGTAGSPGGVLPEEISRRSDSTASAVILAWLNEEQEDDRCDHIDDGDSKAAFKTEVASVD